jgi:hypothetical protein
MRLVVRFEADGTSDGGAEVPGAGGVTNLVVPLDVRGAS